VAALSLPKGVKRNLLSEKAAARLETNQSNLSTFDCLTQVDYVIKHKKGEAMLFFDFDSSFTFFFAFLGHSALELTEIKSELRK
jgi:hypothetical protein